MKRTKEQNKMRVGTQIKAQRGITLIALIITIIVMLILVVVTISMAIKGELFQKAGKAAGDTKNAIDAEQTLANGMVYEEGKWYASIDDYIAGNPIKQEIVLSAETLKLEIDADYNVEISTPVTGELTATLNEIEGVVNWLIDNENVATINVTDTTAVVTAVAAGTAKITASCTFEGETYTATCDIIVEEPEPKITSSEVYKDLTTYLGQTVDYEIEDTSTYSGEWEIFYADEEHIYIITKGYLESAALSIDGYNGTTDFTAENLQSKYPAVAAGLLNLTYDPTAAGTEDDPYLKYSSTNNNMKATQYLLDSTVWATYANNDYADWAIGGPTYELFVDSYNEYCKIDTSLTQVTLSAPSGYGYANPLSTSGLVPTGTYLNHSTSYWLACPSNLTKDSVGNVRGDLTLCGLQGYNYSREFRPVVCLDSDVQITWNSSTSQYDLSWVTEN